MANVKRLHEDATGQLFAQLDDVRAGMLGVEGSAQHMQPMTHFADAETQTLWFITGRSTDLVAAIGAGRTAHFTITSTDQDYHACMSGPIRQSQDRARLDDLWSPMAGAWFDGGPDDPEVVLLEMPLRQAAIWASRGNVLRVGFEMAKAAIRSQDRPDVGDHVVVDFHATA
jgi:general stress protein 26